MKVETVTTSNGKTRYMLVGSDCEPVLPAMRFIKFKDNSGAARNSLRSYCQHLKLFFEFLDQESLDYRQVNIDDIENLRKQQVATSSPKQIKREMTDVSKDIIIAAKNKRIKELEAENKRMKEELKMLRGRLYESLK